MVFGLEQVGQFFANVNNWFIGLNLIIVVIFAFLVFLGLNAFFIWGYVKIISTLPTIINKIKELFGKLDRWLS
jgi:hypothetical protein